MNARYFFETPPSFKYTIPFLIFFLVLLLFGVVLRLFRKKYKKNFLYSQVYKRVFWSGLIFGISGLMLLFFRYEAIPLLSYRIWFLIWLLIFSVMKGYFLWDYFFRIKKDYQVYLEKKTKEKWFVKKKKK